MVNKEFSILHISDLHFFEKNGVDWKTLFNYLENDINIHYDKENKENLDKMPKLNAPNIIIVSGDISNNGRDYDTAEKFLSKMVTNFLNGDRKRLIIIPGNHDINWNISKMCYEKIDFDEDKLRMGNKPNSIIRIQRIKNELKLFKRIEGLYFSRFSNFVDFFNNFYKGDLTYPVSPSQEYIIYELGNEFGVVIVGFNSCYGIDHLCNQPFINTHAIISATEYIEKRKDLKNLIDDLVKSTNSI